MSPADLDRNVEAPTPEEWESLRVLLELAAAGRVRDHLGRQWAYRADDPVTDTAEHDRGIE